MTAKAAAKPNAVAAASDSSQVQNHEELATTGAAPPVQQTPGHAGHAGIAEQVKLGQAGQGSALAAQKLNPRASSDATVPVQLGQGMRLARKARGARQAT